MTLPCAQKFLKKISGKDVSPELLAVHERRAGADHGMIRMLPQATAKEWYCIQSASLHCICCLNQNDQCPPTPAG